MKTNKVIKELEKMNLKTQILESSLLVFDRAGETIARVDLKEKFVIDTNFWNFRGLTEDEREKVYVLLTKLAETDPSEREEEKRYYLKHKWISYTGRQYLNLYIDENKYSIDTKCSFDNIKTQFTLEEINEIKRKFNTNLQDFELIEVVEE